MRGDFYGRGASVPMRIGVRGNIRESADLDKIRESILVVLNTQMGERIMRPDFGANLRSLAFAPNNTATAALARHYILDALERWETRIRVRGIEVTNDIADHRLLIQITYLVRDELQPQSMIYPFYLAQA
jgi:phage baseplate assembly protein W